MLTLVEDLEADLRSANSLLIVGSGVSIAATGGHPTASWNGLLLDGIAYCVEKMRSLSANEAAALRDQLAHDDVAERIQVAHTVQQKLGADLLRWLTEAIGTLPIKDRAVLDAVHAIGTRIATTNYDGLLEHGRDLAPIRVTDPNKTLQFLRGTRNGILHLHGYWDDEPPSVVLGTESYERLVSNEVAQFLQRAIAARYTVVFVGCGDGMSDPNLGPLLRWMSDALRETVFRNYVLCRDQDIDPLRAHGLDAMRYVSYGHRYEDLETFLRLLRTDSSISVQTPEQAVITDEIAPSSTTAPTLFVGIGGSGASILSELKAKLKPGDPAVIRALDLDPHAGFSSKGAAFDPAEFCSFPAEPVAYAVAALIEHPDKESLATIREWCPDLDSLRVRYVGAEATGAAQWRLLGRLGLFLFDRQIHEALASALVELDQRRVDFASGGSPAIVLISSLSGGTGSGMLFDVAVILRRLRPDIPIHACLLLPEVFDFVPFRERIYSNAFATLWEIANLKNQHIPFEANYPRIVPVTARASVSPFQRVYLFGPWAGDKRPFREPHEMWAHLSNGIRLAATDEVRSERHRTQANGDPDVLAPLSSSASHDVFCAQSAASIRLIDYPKLADLCVSRFLCDISSDSAHSSMLDLLAPHADLNPAEILGDRVPDVLTRESLMAQYEALARADLGRFWLWTDHRIEVFLGHLRELMGSGDALQATEPPGFADEIRRRQRQRTLDHLRQIEKTIERVPREFERFLLRFQRLQSLQSESGRRYEFSIPEPFEASRREWWSLSRLLLPQRFGSAVCSWIIRDVTDGDLAFWTKQATDAGMRDAIASLIAETTAKWSFLPKLRDCVDEYLEDGDGRSRDIAVLDGLDCDPSRALDAELHNLPKHLARAAVDSFLDLFQSLFESARRADEQALKQLLVVGWINQVRDLFRRDLAVTGGSERRNRQRYRFVEPNALFSRDQIRLVLERCINHVFVPGRRRNENARRAVWIRLPDGFRNRSEFREFLVGTSQGLFGANAMVIDAEDAAADEIVVVVEDLFHGADEIRGIRDYYDHYDSYPNPLALHVHKDWPARFQPLLGKPKEPSS